MNSWKRFFNQPKFRYLDHSKQTMFHNEPFTAMTSFAIDDVLALSVGDTTSPPTIRFWSHEKTVVLGIPDTRLPYLTDGLQHLTHSGYEVIVRNSGGLAVALDTGVLNISLIIPNAKKITIHDCYDVMFHFIQYMLQDFTNNIKAYEIIGSYCPGDYDLSIDGIKFAGISQRRIKDGAAIQIYVDVEGNSNSRAKLIRSFYDLSHRGEETKFTYPIVDYRKMGSLSSILNQDITIDQIKTYAEQSLAQLCQTIVTTPFSNHELVNFENRLAQMKKRNEGIAQRL